MDVPPPAPIDIRLYPLVLGVLGSKEPNDVEPRSKLVSPFIGVALLGVNGGNGETDRGRPFSSARARAFPTADTGIRDSVRVGVNGLSFVGVWGLFTSTNGTPSIIVSDATGVRAGRGM